MGGFAVAGEIPNIVEFAGAGLASGEGAAGEAAVEPSAANGFPETNLLRGVLATGFKGEPNCGGACDEAAGSFAVTIGDAAKGAKDPLPVEPELPNPTAPGADDTPKPVGAEA